MYAQVPPSNQQYRVQQTQGYSGQKSQFIVHPNQSPHQQPQTNNYKQISGQPMGRNMNGNAGMQVMDRMTPQYTRTGQMSQRQQQPSSINMPSSTTPQPPNYHQQARDQHFVNARQTVNNRPDMAQRMRMQNTPVTQPIAKPPSNASHKLYYSDFCVHSKKFLQQLVKTPLYEKFEKINVSEGTHMIPPYVRKVPTIEVPGAERPLVGEEVFGWLDKISEQTVGTSNEIKPFMPNEMGSDIGNNYSYLDVEDVEQPMEHSFAFVGREDTKINTPPEEEFVEMKSKRTAEVNSYTRPPLPQGPSKQPMMSNSMDPPPALVPQSVGGGDKKEMEAAYKNLMERRAQDLPHFPPPKEE